LDGLLENDAFDGKKNNSQFYLGFSLLEKCRFCFFAFSSGINVYSQLVYTFYNS